MKVIVPCCGRSTRFPNLPPKWMLPTREGAPMICSALAEMTFDLDDLIVTILREHDDRYGAADGLVAAFGRPIRTCILERPTSSQSATVAETLRQSKIAEPFLVKDSDGSFRFTVGDEAANYVCVESLRDCPLAKPESKSYVQVGDSGAVTAIREKQVISDLFNVGGYAFRSPAEFLDYYDRVTRDPAASGEAYLSKIIDAMLADGLPFRARKVDHYRDWGTVEDWRRDLDDATGEQGHPFFRPRAARSD
jgi:NDP-sugar pyrophosphorylase family protein